ncbi:MAG: hypothetical protein JWL81_2490 [Verrucomicrobiales bacterium]|nr:hypothetical protein [Verrucomicrobiales bacterium]
MNPRFPLSLSVLSAVVFLAGILAPPEARADITYSFNFDPASSAQAQQVANSVAVAAAFYNQNASFNKHWNVYYNAGIPTAEANFDGYMGFGGTRNERVVFHEAAHTFGMGTGPAYGGLIAGGVWKGFYGNQAQFETYNDFGDGLHGDGHAIWPGGFNYDNEDGFIERYWQARIMAGIRADMGILSFTREARNDAVVAGGTAVFSVESPRAVSWQWTKNNANLTDGGDISGARSATLRIANAEAADAGTYRCIVTGAAETLTCRPRQLWVHAAPLLGQWNFNGNATDNGNALNAAAVGAPVYVAGKIGQAVDLDGVDDYIDLPDAAGRTRELTVASWVNWDGGNNWQRLFDFGSGTSQYLFLSPKSGSSTMRLALRDAINGKDVEYQVNAPILTVGQWGHVAAVVGGGSMKLYVNGKAVGAAFDVEGSPVHFPATNNYIGKSQFADPLFNGRVDDFRLYARALSGAEVWNVWGQSANKVPVFSPAEIVLPPVNALGTFAGASVASHATDEEGDPIIFSKINGPSWLSVSAAGFLSGQPGPGDLGNSTLVVRATDPSGGGSDLAVRMQVSGPPSAPVTASTTAPVRDADDVFHSPGNMAENGTINGTTTAADNDEFTYTAENRSAKGQSFTTGSNPRGYFLESFTFQQVNWPTFTSAGTFYDIQPGDQWEIQVGTLSGSLRTPLTTYTATFDGASLTGSGNSGTGRYLTFNLSGLGVALAPDTTYYFAIAPLAGEPSIELNSSKTGTYTGGTAFRGTVAGTLGSATTLMGGDFSFHANLEKTPDLSPATVAYWNFEEGTANTPVPYTRSAANLYEGSIFDQSGNGNNLSVWTTAWHNYRAIVPASSTPQIKEPNTLSLQNAGAFPAVSALGTSLTNWSPTAWTIEAAIRPDDATAAGYQTFIGRDSVGAFGGDPALAAFYFAVTPTGALRLVFTDAAGNNWAVTSAANAIQDGKWHAVAATSDGSTVSIYRKNITNGDASYTLLGSTSLATSTNPALSAGSGDGADWDPGVWTFARGLYNGGHTDRFFGYLDDIRFTEGALAPTNFLYSPATLTPAQTWRQTYFSTTHNSGTAADAADPDQDGISNLMERALGGNPTVASPEILPALDPEAWLLNLIYTRAKAFPDLTLTVQESADASLGNWIPAVGTEELTDLGTTERVVFTAPPGGNERKFLRLKVVVGP